MKKICVLSDHKGMNGSTIGLLDFQQYLRDFENYNTRFICNEIVSNREILKKSHRQYIVDDIDYIKKINNIKGVLITDFKSLSTCFLFDKRMLADKAVILDNLELSLFLKNRTEALFYPDIDLYDCLNFHKFKEVIFLMPPSNKKAFDKRYTDLQSIEFYKKIHIPLIQTIKIRSNDKLFFRSHNFYNIRDIGFLDISSFIKDRYPGSVELNIKNDESVFDFKGYIYTKKPEVFYYEQFGRLIFEFTLLDKEIHWFDDPYRYNDGLRDYINYYSLDKEQIEYMMMQKYEVKPWE